MSFVHDAEACAVTAILPEHRLQDVIEEVISPLGLKALSWRARGTLLKDSWLQRFLPPISPSKVMFRSIVPQALSQRVVRDIATVAQLHQQATGAVYSERCNGLMMGAASQVLPAVPEDTQGADARPFSNDLAMICCVVDKEQTDRIARAAIMAGAHGPVVHLAEGRGLRDRLGWLRITKRHEKDVLLVLCARSEVEAVFHEMALAGELTKPGRGFMYRVDIEEGIFNLPSRVSSHHYAANVQQIINAIDHLSGHTHWRDGGLKSVGAGVQSAGLAIGDETKQYRLQQQCLSAIVPRSDHNALIEHVLDCGAKGVNFGFAHLDQTSQPDEAGAVIQDDYALIQCVADHFVIQEIQRSAEAEALPSASGDWLLYTSDVMDRATYVYRPGQRDNRAHRRPRAA